MSGDELPSLAPADRHLYFVDGKLTARDLRRRPRTMLLLNPATREVISVRVPDHTSMTIDAYVPEIERLKQAAELSEAELVRTRASLSWRITGPLRVVRSRLGQVGGSLLRYGRRLSSR